MPIPRIGRPGVVHPIVPRQWKRADVPRKVGVRHLGTRKELLYALSEGGKSVASIVREKKLDISRQRVQQILREEYDIEVRKIIKTVAWYARHVGKPRLAKRNYVKRGVCKHTLKGFAKRLRISEAVLRRICRMHQISSPLTQGRCIH